MVLLLFNYQGEEGQVIGPGCLPELSSSVEVSRRWFGTKVHLENMEEYIV
jgi:hypothetical protein